MEHIVVVLDKEGKYLNAYTNSEIDFRVLQEGTDDKAIAEAEVSMEPVEQELTS